MPRCRCTDEERRARHAADALRNATRRRAESQQQREQRQRNMAQATRVQRVQGNAENHAQRMRNVAQLALWRRAQETNEDRLHRLSALAARIAPLPAPENAFEQHGEELQQQQHQQQQQRSDQQQQLQQELLRQQELHHQQQQQLFQQQQEQQVLLQEQHQLQQQQLQLRQPEVEANNIQEGIEVVPPNGVQRRNIAHFLGRQNKAFRLPPLHYFGTMHRSCTKYHAKYFPQELNCRNQYTKCCHGGAVVLPALAPPPQEIMNLFTGKHCNIFKKAHFTPGIIFRVTKIL